MNRRETREHLFRMLFRKDFHTEEELKEQISLYLESLEEQNNEDKFYLKDKLNAIIDSLDEIDRLIEEASSGWKLKRMGKIDLTILRLAVYEMKYDEDVPMKVAINEAVEIAKIFGGDHSPSFVNGILGKIAETV